MLQSSTHRLLRLRGDTLAATLSAAAVALLGTLALLSYELGPRAMHMGLHIAVMSILAPAVAAICASRLPRWASRAELLWLSAAVQLALLWAWHAPAVERFASGSHGVHAAAHLSLLIASGLFWAAIVDASGPVRWHAVAALLVTGKLTCLLSALLVFSPRTLYAGGEADLALADQQLAGLLMLTACPVSYLVAALVITIRLVNGAAGFARSGAPDAG